MSNKTKKAPVQEFSKQSSKAPAIFMAWSKVFAIFNDLL